MSKDTSSFSDFREKEFPQLNDVLYLDFAGAMPISQSQVKRYQYLTNLVICNPHSASQINQASIEISQLRSTILSLFKLTPDDYIVIFSHNTTTAAQTVASLLKIEDPTQFCYNYLYDNHNSIFGLSEIFKSRFEGKTKYHCISPSEIQSIDQILKSSASKSLFAFPAVSNFNGKKYNYSEWIKTAHESGHLILLDAASTSTFDLSASKPDFVVLSLLKLFGSHGGALLVRRDRVKYLQNPPPSGGTLLYSCSQNCSFKLLPLLNRRLEGGTPSYVDLFLAHEGAKVRSTFGSEEKISEHLKALSLRFFTKASELKHKNGSPLVRFYQEQNEYPTFAFNILKEDGEVVNQNDILFCFSALKINVRSGSHCNPGATFSELKWSPDEVVSFGESSSLNNRCASSLCIVGGRPVATLRVSFGYPTLFSDIDKFVSVIGRLFLNGGPNPSPSSKEVVLPMKIEKIIVSPISGCRGYEVNESLYDKYGLIFDRRWVLLDEDGNKVSSPVCFGVASLTAIVLDEGKHLRLNYNDTKMIDVDVNPVSDLNSNAPDVVKSYGLVYSEKVSEFLFETLGVFAYLVKLNNDKLGKFPFSLITKESTDAVFPNFDDQRWHPNFVMSGIPAFSEEGKRKNEMKLGSAKSGWTPISLWRWRVTCMTSAVVPGVEEVEYEEMKKLVEMRSNYGSTPFGILFGTNLDGCENGLAKIAIGDFIAEA